jgi:hypothetical protein
MDYRGFAGTAALPDYVHSSSPILWAVLSRGVRDARRSRPEACSTLSRIDAGYERVGPAAPRAVRRAAYDKTVTAWKSECVNCRSFLQRLNLQSNTLIINYLHQL